MRGRVVATREGDEALEVIDRLSHKYTGEPFPMRSGVVYEIEPERLLDGAPVRAQAGGLTAL